MSDEQPPLMPDDIRRLFEKHWIGSEDDLDTALKEFFKDIQSSYTLALDETNDDNCHGNDRWEGVNTTQAMQTVEDYVNNHYF